MLNVLLESRTPRTRRVKSTLTSALVHAGLMASAVALTMPGPVDANGVAKPTPPIVWVDAPRTPPAVAPTHGSTTATAPTAPAVQVVPISDLIPNTLPPIDVGPAMPPDQIVIGNSRALTGSPIGVDNSSLLSGGAGTPIDEHLVDRAPRLLGRALEPRYPASLREAGVQGRVVVQFVVDTLGRAELGELQVVESSQTLFVDAVRAALARYRFSPGEVAGRAVRTRVQIPFDFTLTR
jgi:protein TonB